MKCNVGTGIDRIGRTVIGIALLDLGLVGPLGMTGRIVITVIAVVVLATAIVRFCPGYAIFGISTCKDEEKK
ncbi:hypothetical protein FGKAn22_20500 [Ferrigenium kumadai]|uniref:Inner membrane protein YgaP-like transmembrane domain-containing protein n=1 Tax=Ferrigenium kumadai TaxID=1682490 RepID=A0AAN1T0W0_9PROT|nr:DUF2892 domain-containing protein [Ferrigenium kumadai]BBJ00358.1 hypothetical protein FGKAn22_20500 [Ferrigenium kumadai]